MYEPSKREKFSSGLWAYLAINVIAEIQPTMHTLWYSNTYAPSHRQLVVLVTFLSRTSLPIYGSLIYRNNITSDAIIPTFATISFHFYPIQ